MLLSNRRHCSSKMLLSSLIGDTVGQNRYSPIGSRKTEEFYTYKLFSIFRLVLHTSYCIFEYFCTIYVYFFLASHWECTFLLSSPQKKSQLSHPLIFRHCATSPARTGGALTGLVAHRQDWWRSL
jgi:hypothetical protein